MAVIVAACSAGGTDAMAELMHDAGAMLADAGQKLMDAAADVDAAGPSDARAAADSPSVHDAVSSAMDAQSRPAEAAAPADGQQPAKTPPRALEAACSLSRTTSTTTGTLVSTTYYAQFDVADVNAVRQVLGCDPASNDHTCAANATCGGFSPPLPECSTGIWGFAAQGKFYLWCGVAFPTCTDTHFRKARIIVA